MKDFFHFNLNTVLLLVAIVIFWTNGFENPVTHPELLKENDSLKIANTVVVGFAHAKDSENDSLKELLYKKLHNTDQAKKRHEENRKAIEDLSTDSLFRIFNQRIQPK